MMNDSSCFLFCREYIIYLEGFISSCEHGQGRSASDRQFYFINSRPCDPAKVIKVVNEVYHQYNRYQYPCVVLNIRLKEDDVDINVTPDKRQILVNNEKLLLATIKTSMIRLYGNIPNSFKMQNTSLNNSFTSSQSNNTPSRASPSVGSPSNSRISALSQKFGRKSEGSPLSNLSPTQPSTPLSVFSLKRSFSNSSCADESPSNKQPKLESFLAKCKSDPGKNPVTSIKSEEDDKSFLSDFTPLENHEIVTNGDKNDIENNDAVKEECEDMEGGRKMVKSENTSAEDELRKEISKDMFAKMEILGQFNLGFIIARFGSDLFIIDQHATDEKYNFETLQATCTIQNQRLIAPQQLN
ncbi:hypothetical protein C7M84_023906 [Penaeus vannamei]|uniref:DNA mismatch repair protein S5 domain-containing protein n=1 Tax=Penaeus vannamei TaxID=6689 RepID=A0A3R7PDP4_PENVA|nr:hypothetical protein C7M84_023906 [Penaeus vannamei]